VVGVGVIVLGGVTVFCVLGGVVIGLFIAFGIGLESDVGEATALACSPKSLTDIQDFWNSSYCFLRLASAAFFSVYVAIEYI